ncbi:MAG: DUF2062 domain-containing protein [Rhodospirillaceae bacterium]|nr:MAG: DUF2062 domain-containing protein [Rhodospirillaceae bacterium]
MFRRRTPLSLSARLRNLVWPSMGPRRTASYVWHRLQRIPGTSSSIAAGFAIGVAVAMSPIIGTHMILAMALSWLVGGNIVAAIIGTLMVNPWTAPPIWFTTYYIGRFMQGLPVLGRANAPPFIVMFKGLTEAALKLDVKLFAKDVWPLLKPMLLGSIPLGLASGVAIYVVLLPILTTLHGKRRNGARARTNHDPRSTG